MIIQTTLYRMLLLHKRKYLYLSRMKFGEKMNKPKCPQCEINEHIVLINTGKKIGSVVGGVAGGAAIGNKVGEIVDESRSLFKCNKCNKEF